MLTPKTQPSSDEEILKEFDVKMKEFPTNTSELYFEGVNGEKIETARHAFIRTFLTSALEKVRSSGYKDGFEMGRFESLADHEILVNTILETKNAEIDKAREEERNKIEKDPFFRAFKSNQGEWKKMFAEATKDTAYQVAVVKARAEEQARFKSLITEEINTSHAEGQPTSRLTSLWVKIDS